VIVFCAVNCGLFTDVAVITVVPCVSPATIARSPLSPPGTTEATSGFEDVHVTFLLAALDGVIVASNCMLEYSITDSLPASEMPLTGIGPVILIVLLAEYAPEVAVTVTVPAPFCAPYTVAVHEGYPATTVARSLFTDHVTFISLTFVGVTVAVSVVEASSLIVIVPDGSVMPVDATVASASAFLIFILRIREVQ